MSAEIIRFPKSFESRLNRAKANILPKLAAAKGTTDRAKVSPAEPRKETFKEAQTPKKGLSIWIVCWTILVLGWPLVNIVFFFDLAWRGLVALYHASDTFNYYGLVFLVHFAIYAGLAGARYFTPKEIS